MKNFQIGGGAEKIFPLCLCESYIFLGRRGRCGGRDPAEGVAQDARKRRLARRGRLPPSGDSGLRSPSLKRKLHRLTNFTGVKAPACAGRRSV
jgi:hypothetical protein